jgi:hypothetical protein
MAGQVDLVYSLRVFRWHEADARVRSIFVRLTAHDRYPSNKHQQVKRGLGAAWQAVFSYLI